MQKNPPGVGAGRPEEFPLHSPPLDRSSTGRSWAPRRTNHNDKCLGWSVCQGPLEPGWSVFNLTQKTDLSKEIEILFPRKAEWKENFNISL